MNKQNKMSFDFALPLNRKDLLESSVTNQYVVEDVYHSRQVADRVMGEYYCLANSIFIHIPHVYMNTVWISYRPGV